MKRLFEIKTKDEGNFLHSMENNFKKWHKKEQFLNNPRINDGDIDGIATELTKRGAIRTNKKGEYKLTQQGRNALEIYSRSENFVDWVKRNAVIITIVVAILGTIPLWLPYIKQLLGLLTE